MPGSSAIWPNVGALPGTSSEAGIRSRIARSIPSGVVAMRRSVDPAIFFCPAEERASKAVIPVPIARPATRKGAQAAPGATPPARAAANCPPSPAPDWRATSEAKFAEASPATCKAGEAVRYCAIFGAAFAPCITAPVPSMGSVPAAPSINAPRIRSASVSGFAKPIQSEMTRPGSPRPSVAPLPSPSRTFRLPRLKARPGSCIPIASLAFSQKLFSPCCG